MLFLPSAALPASGKWVFFSSPDPLLPAVPNCDPSQCLGEEEVDEQNRQLLPATEQLPRSVVSARPAAAFHQRGLM